VPELPEVERARTLLEERALGREVVTVDDSDGYVTRPHGPGEISDALVGRTFTAARRIGKSMWLETDGGDGPELGLHLGMAGRIVIGEESGGDPVYGGSGGSQADHTEGDPTWHRFTVRFADGGPPLVLFDKRRLGRAVLNPDHSHLGPDAQEITRDEFRARVGRGGGPLKARIMDQSVLAGVGNLLADEALWRAHLSPLRPAGELTDEELDRLRRSIRATTRRAIERGGVHTGDLIPHRTRGDGICPSCGAELVHAQVGGRTTWWCPVEQPGPRPQR